MPLPSVAVACATLARRAARDNHMIVTNGLTVVCETEIARRFSNEGRCENSVERTLNVLILEDIARGYCPL
uniref:Uncharacterized protein n=1 Tax=Pristionchus pacificus TaxID=54126 RepID=A0A2A6BN18_PRIPA|eukprot:PDM67299.1 hypothetical protein PRIPAC_48716 [Pristionchus pacificus]